MDLEFSELTSSDSCTIDTYKWSERVLQSVTYYLNGINIQIDHLMVSTAQYLDVLPDKEMVEGADEPLIREGISLDVKFSDFMAFLFIILIQLSHPTIESDSYLLMY